MLPAPPSPSFHVMLVLGNATKPARSRMPLRRLSEFAVLPVRGSALAAGYDLAAAYDCVIPARGKNLVKTDLAIACPEGTYGRIGTRSKTCARLRPPASCSALAAKRRVSA